MLKLHRVEISGFKTFVDPVSTEFSRGITAIVGPNGCGKSNFSEAITWVLGEQSAKSLRGGRMEDVIFNGSQGRRPLGMAEVGLELSTDPSFEAAEDGIVQIGRRVLRTGESQYRLNGRVVPLKRIKDLLMDTGLGIRMYSVIGQGRVEMILSGKPTERRQLLEEAAGITRYKARKRVAEIKLEEARANLHRLEDVVGEVERSLRSLKRQANAALRYREHETLYKELLRDLLLAKWRRAWTQMGDLRRRLAELESAEAEIVATLHAEESELLETRQVADSTAQRLGEQHERQSDLAARIEGRQEFLKAARRTIEDTAERLERGGQLAERFAAERQAQEQALTDLDARHRDLLSEHEQASAAVDADLQAIEQAQETLTSHEQRLETLRAELLSSTGQMSSLQNRLHEEQIESEKGRFRRSHTQSELDRLADSLQNATEQAQAAEANAAQRVAAVEDLGKRRDETGAALEQALGGEAELQTHRQELQAGLAGLRQRRDMLAELESEASQRREALQSALEDAGVGRVRFLADSVTVPDGWEETVDLYLDRLRGAVLLGETDDGIVIGAKLAAKVPHCVLVKPAAATPVEGLEDDLQPLPAALGLPARYHGSLPPAFLVESRQHAVELAALHPGCAFLSRDAFWAVGGVAIHQGASSRPGALARRRELKHLDKSIPATEEQLRRAAKELEDAVVERSRLAESKNRLDAELADAVKEDAVARARLQEARGRHGELTAKQEELAADQKRTLTELTRIEEQRTALRAQLEESQSRHTALEASFDEASGELAAARERRELLRTAGAGRQGRLDLLAERVAAHSQERRRIEANLAEIESRSAQWKDEAAALETRREETKGQIDAAEMALQEALEKRQTAQEAVLEEQQKLDGLRQRIAALDKAVSERRGTLEARRSELEALRVRRATAEQTVDHLRLDYTEAFREAPPEVLVPGAKAQGGAAAEDEDADENAVAVIDDLETRVHECKATLDRLGPVNLLAADEYTENEERHAFLIEQRTDVLDSIDRLRKTIREINKSSSERFLTTFEEVNRSFGELFTVLFRGGEAEMRLQDEEDVLESGIEIVARPPGKKPQNITLLSGGEKALTAIALLFALFRTKPSPFCILDEVDAALDDANVLRFTELLRTMSGETQFIVITHNKLTMQCAAALYGVTMEEKGVSKLVAVDFENMHPEDQLAETG